MINCGPLLATDSGGRQQARNLSNHDRGRVLCVLLYASVCCASATKQSLAITFRVVGGVVVVVVGGGWCRVVLVRLFTGTLRCVVVVTSCVCVVLLSSTCHCFVVVFTPTCHCRCCVQHNNTITMVTFNTTTRRQHDGVMLLF